MDRLRWAGLGRWLLVAAIAVLVFFLPGVDLYSHLHFSWLYNYMMQHKTFMIYDFSMLNGQQFIYTVGMVAYLLSGALWFLAGKSAVMLIEVVGLVVLFIVSQKLFGRNLLASAWMVVVFLFMLSADMYPYFVSLVLFYLGLYLMHTKKDRLGEASMLLAGLNHPYVSVANFVFLFSKRRFLKIGVVLVFLLQATLFGYKFFSGIGYDVMPLAFTLWIIPSVVIRTSVLFLPLAVKLFLPKIIPRIRLVYLWAALLIGAVIVYHIAYTTEMPVQYKIDCYYKDKYLDVGKLEGSVRVVDICRSGLYSLPAQGNVLTLSPYFEGQEYYRHWEKGQYLEYLKLKNASYVIHCKGCTWLTTEVKPANELEMLQQSFPIYKETGEYYIFDVK